MRTTLTIDNDVLNAAKVTAERESRNIGEVVSDLARRSLRHQTRFKTRNVIPLLLRENDGAQVTMETVNRLRDGLP